MSVGFVGPVRIPNCVGIVHAGCYLIVDERGNFSGLGELRHCRIPNRERAVAPEKKLLLDVFAEKVNDCSIADGNQSMLVTKPSPFKAGINNQLVVANSILDLIGNTPVLELHRMQKTLNLPGRLLAKLEHLNPGGSKKDRVAVTMIRQARQSCRLSAGAGGGGGHQRQYRYRFGDRLPSDGPSVLRCDERRQ